MDAADVDFTYLSVRTSTCTTSSDIGETKCSPSASGGTDVSTAFQCSSTPRCPASGNYIH